MNYFYTATEDGEHCDVGDLYPNIFDALADYYKNINDGSQGYLEGIELGQWLDYDGENAMMETIDYHEFVPSN